MTARKRLEEKRPNTFIGRAFGVGDVIVWDEEKGRKFFYVDKEELVEFGGFMDADAAGNTVVYMVPNYQIDGKTGTWLPYDSEVVEDVCFFMMRNEQRKDAVSPIVVDSKGVFVTDAPNGFENVRSILTEYVHRDTAEKEKISVGAERQRRYRAMKRWRADQTEENFWGVVVAYAGVKFKTYSGLPFSYEIKKGRSGEYTKELWIDRRENSKSLAWSSVLLALGNIKKVGEVVERPKALGDIRGVTYIYGMFYRFGLINVPDEAKEKMKKAFGKSF